MMKFFLTLILFMAHLQATQTQVVILLGPPGAGKGSQAALIKDKMGIPHVSTGDLLRENIHQNTPLGKKAKKYMDTGQLVPDELILDMLFTRVEKPDCKKGYILDGFPRNIPQAKALQKKLTDQQTLIVISLDVSDKEILERITKREICKSCQTPYHSIFSPPKVSGKCDLCQGELYHRTDDAKEVVEERLKVYRKQTAPLLDFYDQQKSLHTISASHSKEEIASEILRMCLQNSAF